MGFTKRGMSIPEYLKWRQEQCRKAERDWLLFWQAHQTSSNPLRGAALLEAVACLLRPYDLVWQEFFAGTRLILGEHRR